MPCVKLLDVMWTNIIFSKFDYLCGDVMNEFYKLAKGLIFLSVQLYRILRSHDVSHDVSDVVVNWGNENVDVL